MPSITTPMWDTLAKASRRRRLVCIKAIKAPYTMLIAPSPASTQNHSCAASGSSGTTKRRKA